MGSTGDLYGARVDTAGNVLDPGGNQLFSDSSTSKPAVAYDGSNLMVAIRNGC